MDKTSKEKLWRLPKIREAMVGGRNPFLILSYLEKLL